MKNDRVQVLDINIKLLNKINEYTIHFDMILKKRNSNGFTLPGNRYPIPMPDVTTLQEMRWTETGYERQYHIS